MSFLLISLIVLQVSWIQLFCLIVIVGHLQKQNKMATQVTKINSYLTKILLVCGIISGPLFIAVVLTQFFTRAGADIHRLPLSLLSLGDLGWIQIANFIITGLLALACAIGIRRVLAGGKVETWGPLLVSTYGLGLILAGIFHPDPGYGFPLGAPAGASPTISSHAMVHNLGFLIVVLSLISASFVFARGFKSRGMKEWATYSNLTGIVALVLLVVGFATYTIMAITLMGFIAFGWVSMIAGRLNA